ncbi:MAG: hypothetical protein OXF54_08645 [Caldilineaceae bacterium]|nr:hypothetical protein [Caldilineaceae bacterium]
MFPPLVWAAGLSSHGAGIHGMGGVLLQDVTGGGATAGTVSG